MQTETIFTARYSETDQMGIIHHSNYAVWFEAGRTDLLKKVGISYSSIEALGVLLPLYEMSCRFKRPAKYEDEIHVISCIKKLTRTRVIFSYSVYKSNEETPIATGETMHAWTSKDLKPLNAEKEIPQVFSLLNSQTTNKGE